MQHLTFESISDYVGFDASSSQTLREFHPQAAPHIQDIIDDFYAVIQRHPEAHEAITGGAQQIARLKRTLVTWLASVLMGPHDAAYVDAHARIGRVHVRIALPQQFMFSAMNRIRGHLNRIAINAYRTDPPRQERTIEAINQILDLELALMLDTYRTDALDRMRAHERLATIGQVAGSVGHELRNPLGIIESSLYIVRAQLGSELDPKVEKHLERIAEQVRISSNTITQLLDLARNRPPRRTWKELHAVASQALEYFDPPPGSSIKLGIDRDLQVLADPDQLRQVLLNLFQNAVQARADVSVTVAARSVSGGVEIDIIDDGPGIPADLRARVFDALFTTRSKGTGLGLSVCKNIMLAHQGEIRLQPTATGTHLRLWFPDHHPEPEAEAL